MEGRANPLGFVVQWISQGLQTDMPPPGCTSKGAGGGFLGDQTNTVPVLPAALSTKWVHRTRVSLSAFNTRSQHLGLSCVCVYLRMYVYVYLKAYMYVYIHVAINESICVCICLHMFTCFYSICVYKSVYGYLYMHKFIYMWVCIYVCMYIAMKGCMCVSACLYICMTVYR